MSLLDAFVAERDRRVRRAGTCCEGVWRLDKLCDACFERDYTGLVVAPGYATPTEPVYA